MRQDRTSRDWGRQKEMEGWLVFDSLKLTSTWTISLMEGATTGHIKETEKDGSSVLREKEREKGERRHDCKTESTNTQSETSRCSVSNLSGNTSECDGLINDAPYLSSVGPPQAVAGLGGGNGDYGRGAGDTVTPVLAQEGP